jgi:excisionase family DNA binding protein
MSKKSKKMNATNVATPAADKRSDGRQKSEASPNPLRMYQYMKREKENLDYAIDNFHLKQLVFQDMGFNESVISTPGMYEEPTIGKSDALPEVYSLKEAAAILKVSARTVCNYIKKGNLKAIKINGRNKMVTREAIDDFYKGED